MLFLQRICRLGLSLGLGTSLGVMVILSFNLSQTASAKSDQVVEVAGTPCGTTAGISNIAVTNVTSMTARVSWQTSLPTESCLDLDSVIHPIFTGTQPISKTFQGVAYAPAEYENYLSWVNRDVVTNTIISDVNAIADAGFNSIVLYSAGPTGGAIHPWDQVVFDRAAALGLKIAFRLEWYPASFNWNDEDCDAILNHYDAYLSYFQANPEPPDLHSHQYAAG
jgi:hypothetical protein